MTQFEYTSVAIALVYSFAVSKVIGALADVFAADRRDWIHSLWTVILLFAAAFTWWGIWDLRDVEWNALRFVWALSVPALIHLRAGILVSSEPREIASWREHYERVRVPFFTVGMLIMANIAVLPWVMGAVPWLSPHRGIWGSLILMAVYLPALVSDRRWIQGAVAVANLLMLLALLRT